MNQMAIPVRYGDPIPSKTRLGMSVSATQGPGSEKTLGGPWPKEFLTRYSDGSFVGRIRGERATGAPFFRAVAPSTRRNCGEQSGSARDEALPARVATPKIPDVTV
jgi:hypothetical protein